MTDVTGTETSPFPRLPSTAISTRYAPTVMSHSSAAYSSGSPATGAATSGGGAPPSGAASQRTGRTVTRSIPPPGTRIEISASPGMTSGGRMTTETG